MVNGCDQSQVIAAMYVIALQQTSGSSLIMHRMVSGELEFHLNFPMHNMMSCNANIAQPLCLLESNSCDRFLLYHRGNCCHAQHGLEQSPASVPLPGQS